MSAETKEVGAFAPFIEDNDYRGFDSQEAAQSVLNYLDLHGGTLYVFESSYWGNEAINEWVEMVIADPVVTTDNGGVKVKNVVKVGRIIALLDQYYQAVNEIERLQDPDKEATYQTFTVERWQDQIAEVLTKFYDGLSVDKDKSDWFPESKVKFQTSRRGRDDHVLFRGDGSKVRGIAQDAECVIEGTTHVRTKYNTYQKLAIDIPYQEDDDPKEHFDWEEHHFAAKYERDNFQCWTADTNPREIAEILANEYGSCAVHEDVLGRFDG